MEAIGKIISLLLTIITIILGLFSVGENPPSGGGTDVNLPAEVSVDERTFTKFTELKAFKFDNGSTQLYFRLSEPDSTTIGKKYPLVIFLHGLTNRGSDNSSQILSVMLNGIKNNGEKCYIFLPQIDTNYTWDMSEIDVALNQCIDGFLLKNYPVDKNRIYIAGMSLGANGALTQVFNHRGRYAAAASASGFFIGSDYSRFVNVPIWLAHNSGDPVVPVSYSRNIYNGVKALGGSKIKYTEYSSGEHNSWSRFYAEAALWSWMFSQTL